MKRQADQMDVPAARECRLPEVAEQAGKGCSWRPQYGVLLYLHPSFILCSRNLWQNIFLLFLLPKLVICYSILRKFILVSGFVCLFV